MSIDTSSILNLITQWSDIDIDPLNITNVVSDVGTISYNFTYTSGTGPGKIDTLFHINKYLSGTISDVYDLTSITGSVLGKQVITSFSKIKSISIENVSGSGIDFVVSGTNDLNEPFGYPAANIPIDISGYLHINTTGSGWTVDSSNKFITIGDVTVNNDVTYELLILGEV